MLGQAKLSKPYWALISTSSSLGGGSEPASWWQELGTGDRAGLVRGWEVKGIELGVRRVAGVLGRTGHQLPSSPGPK